MTTNISDADVNVIRSSGEHFAKLAESLAEMAANPQVFTPGELASVSTACMRSFADRIVLSTAMQAVLGRATERIHQVVTAMGTDD